MRETPVNTVGIIVAHPDDETLWCGGTLLLHPAWQCRITALCRASDPDRAPRFFHALESLQASGNIGDLNDGPEQRALTPDMMQATVLSLVGSPVFDLIITHSPLGEYTRHRRHEATGRAVIALWQAGKLQAKEVWLFAYEDGQRAYYPRSINEAAIRFPLATALWKRKFDIITGIYGFSPNSWEGQTTPKTEAFWRISSSADAAAWLQKVETRA